MVLPVAIPAGVDISAAMDNNNTFKVVWQVLNALRSHDEEFAQEINTLILDRKNGEYWQSNAKNQRKHTGSAKNRGANNQVV